MKPLVKALNATSQGLRIGLGAGSLFAVILSTNEHLNAFLEFVFQFLLIYIILSLGAIIEFITLS